jgi:Cdc6-like AAA superfamily ATPase
VTDHFVLPGQGQYLVMDFVEGEDLQTKISQRGSLPEHEVLPWIEQVCDALTYLHRQTPPIIHRDIKPANIRITPDGRAMLVDFGIAKRYEAQGKTTVGAKAITPGFSPPEQYGKGGTDARSDIYALGSTLYAALTGHEPVESVQRTIGTPLHLPRQLNPTISPQVETAILKVMALNPEDRIASALDFKQALQTPVPGSHQPPPEVLPPASPPEAHIPLFPKGRSLELPLICTLEDAEKVVFPDVYKQEVGDILRAMYAHNHAQGKIILLLGDSGVGTTAIAHIVRDRLINDKKKLQLVAFIDLRGADDATFILRQVINRLKQEGHLHSYPGVKKAVEKGYKNAKTVIEARESGEAWEKIDRTGFQIPVEITMPGGPAWGGNVVEKFTEKKTIRSSLQPLELKELRDVLQEFVDAIIQRNIYVTLILDKIDDKSYADILYPVLRTPHVMSLLIVEKQELEKWDEKPLVDDKIYVPKQWKIARKLLSELVGIQNQPDNRLYYQLIDYLDYRACGLPKQLIKYVEKYYYSPQNGNDFENLMTKLSSLHKYHFPFAKHSRLVITEEQSLEIQSISDFHSCICDANYDVWVANGMPLIDNSTSRERYDQLQTSLYNTLNWIESQARSRKKFSFRKLTEQFVENGFSESAGVVKEVTSNLVTMLKTARKVKSGQGGLDPTGLYYDTSIDR